MAASPLEGRGSPALGLVGNQRPSQLDSRLAHLFHLSGSVRDGQSTGPPGSAFSVPIYSTQHGREKGKQYLMTLYSFFLTTLDHLNRLLSHVSILMGGNRADGSDQN